MISAARSYPPRLLPLRLPRVCVAVTAPDAAELVEKAEALVRDNSFLEFRLDYISKPSLALPRIKHFLDTHPGTVVIATCRRVASGGRFRGSIAAQLDILAKASAVGCQLVDVELQTALKCKPAQLQKLRGSLGADSFLSRLPRHEEARRNSGEDARLSGRLLQSGQHGSHSL